MSHKKASSKPRKQRSRYFGAPAHIKRRQFTVQVFGDEAKFPGIRRAPVHKGDKVVVLRGQGTPGGYTDKDSKVKDHEGKVTRVDYKRRLVFIEDLKTRKRGNKVADRPVDPRNVWIVAFDTTDPKRKARLEAQNAAAEG